jgi:hypothetical protein
MPGRTQPAVEVQHRCRELFGTGEEVRTDRVIRESLNSTQYNVDDIVLGVIAKILFY